MIDVKGDGNCLFRCVALALQGTQNTHQEFRLMCANVIQENQAIFKEKIHQGMLKQYDESKEVFQQYIEQVQNGEIMGGLIELQALSLGLNVQFNVEGIGNKLLDIGLSHNPKKEIQLCRIKNDKYKDGHYMFKKIHKIKKKK
ncbi:unnamed protein product (macronuclear) [Paramecium tetraurelia]|uniref:OTU domain-containing protein n=1 Tax=Paramecium tetraurelia TaxID=5888 RepID=A0D806_PARTE|nr:uncharacterized protein GSPATT00014140001 [Paramecium tetraurelia]CAK79173.1 unnamed protein product [Paramecium tetraurelia]|eukprot:XP_001446570.1 hypothetical protein (macronuclear) [Paramecium tetraurelia strain d4-2]